MSQRVNRRRFVAAASLSSLAGTSLAARPTSSVLKSDSRKPALLGGQPLRTKPFLRWPEWDREKDEEMVLAALRSGVWSRAKLVAEFEEKYARLLGAKRCLATTHGTTALLTALHSLEVGVGDEVLVGPYTFIASVAVIFLSGALPIFVDTNRETFLIDADKIEAKITANTRAILPVHIYGLPADMDKVSAIAEKHALIVVEDACQAWLAEWRGRKCGTIGDLGCFSFQESKHLPCGEGGAIVGNDDKVMNICSSYHNLGRPYGEKELTLGGYVRLGSKCRMTEYQAAILLAQMTRLEEQTRRRSENARYLTSKIKQIPGLLPHRLYDGVTQAVYHLYPFRLDMEQLGGLSRAQFVAALRAEGIPCSTGYTPLNRQPFFEDTLRSKNFTRMYTKEQLDRCREQAHCPENDALCKEAVGLSQNLLLGPKEDMDDIANAISKVYENRTRLLAASPAKRA